MSARTNLSWVVALAITALTWAASVALYNVLPETVPTHWNFAGKVDGYGPKSAALFLLPAAMVGVLGIFLSLPYLSPKDFQVNAFRSTYLYLTAVTAGLFAYLHGVILFATWQHVAKAAHPIDIGRTLMIGIFPFVGLMGAVMGKVRRNFFIGVRVPWTLASERVWDDTHRLAARSMVAGSVVGFLIAAAGLSLVLAFAALIVSALVPVVYSFVHYKQLERSGAL